MLKHEKILITGATSQVAFPIARELAKQNEVCGLARFTNAGDRARLEALGVQCIQADMAQDPFDNVPDDFTYLLNFAVLKSGNFDCDLAANAEGLGRLMCRVRQVKAALHCSTGGVYQLEGHTPRKETDCLGDNRLTILPTYGITKIAAEAMARFAARQWNIPTTIARLSVPYGNNGGWPAMHLESMLAGQPIAVHVDKPSTYSLVHEDDYIAHIPKLLQVAAVPATVTNWGGDAVSIEEWCTYIGQLIDVEPDFAYTEHTAASMPLDLTRMHQLLGATTVDWHDGIRRMIQVRHPELTLRR